MPVATLGYYRFTDILFEWHQSITDDVTRSTLKSLINPEVLTHPDNPLRDNEPQGLKLYMGTMPSGESRLLFSSTQVEYMRYWLQTVMKIDPKTLPFPNSSYLMTSESLSSISPIYYDSGPTLRRAQRQIEKYNKKILKADPKVAMFRRNFEKIRAAWAQKYGTWIAMDFEQWEMEHSMTTEFGYSILKWNEKGELVGPIDGHFIVKERDIYRNGKYVPDEKYHFSFGESEILPLKVFNVRIKELVEKAASEGPVFLIFHDARHDLKDLETIGVPRCVESINIPDTPPPRGQYAVDTSSMFAALNGDPNSHVGLARACRLLGLKGMEKMHNAGNDAHFTLMAFQSMASGPPVDAQREERWPGRLEDAPDPATLKVGFKSEDEYSDDDFLL
jgi:hypothetical protein